LARAFAKSFFVIEVIDARGKVAKAKTRNARPHLNAGHILTCKFSPFGKLTKKAAEQALSPSPFI
jgi:hypothetical protein